MLVPYTEAARATLFDLTGRLIDDLGHVRRPTGYFLGRLSQPAPQRRDDAAISLDSDRRIFDRAGDRTRSPGPRPRRASIHAAEGVAEIDHVGVAEAVSDFGDARVAEVSMTLERQGFDQRALHRWAQAAKRKALTIALPAPASAPQLHFLEV